MADATDQLANCGECGTELDEPANTPVEARVPCSSCGSTKQSFVVHLTETVKLSSHLSALHERQGEAIGFSESKRQGRASDASLDLDGSVRMSLVGSSPQGEEDTMAVCQMLKERLNLDGGRWLNITIGDEPADCLLADSHDTNRTLQVQVVRAIVSQDLWRELNSQGSAQRSLSPGAAVAERLYIPLGFAHDGSIESSGDPVLARAGLLHTLLNGISCRFWPTGAFTNHITE